MIDPRTLRSASVLMAIAFAAVLTGHPAAQGDGFEPEDVALTFHKVAGEAMDVQAIASRSQAAMRATNFDRPEVIAAEAARLQGRIDAAGAAREFTITIDDRISEYDHASGEFSITLFMPGYYIPVQAFGQEYRIVFANAAGARAIPMAREPAREFDAQINAFGRHVNNEIRFRVIGKGDAAGAVSGPLVIRAEIVSARLLDRAGRVVFTPGIVAVGAGPAFAGFDASQADAAGLRVGGRVRDMEATLARLFGKVSRGGAGSGSFKGFAGTLEVNNTGCFSIPGRRNNPQPGAVCVTAYFDADEIVRMVRIQRLFPPNFDGEVFRKALVQKYGPASGVARGGIGWGPGVPGAVVNNPAITVDALTASFSADTDVMSTGLNRRENVIVSLQLIDAAWAASMK